METTVLSKMTLIAIHVAIDYSCGTSAHALKASEGGRGLHEEV